VTRLPPNRILPLSRTTRDGAVYKPHVVDDEKLAASIGPEARRERFLEVLREHGIVAEAARAVSVKMATVFGWRQQDPKFDRLFQEAKTIGRYAILDVAVDRALKGSYQPVIGSDGEFVGWVREPSDSVLIAILRRMFPERVPPERMPDNPSTRSGGVERSNDDN
jgi:hypothetical protein